MYQSRSSSGLESARHTRSGVWARRLSKISVAVSPSISTRPFEPISSSLQLVGVLIQMSFQRVEHIRPETAVLRDPPVDLLQSFRAQRVDAPLRLRPDLHELGVA